MTAILCDVCAHEPRIGRIDVPQVGSFGIGARCLALRNAAMNGPVTLRECAPVHKFRRNDPAVAHWIDELTKRLLLFAKCDNCSHAAGQHGGYVGCRACLCPETNSLIADENTEVA